MIESTDDVGMRYLCLLIQKILNALRKKPLEGHKNILSINSLYWLTKQHGKMGLMFAYFNEQFNDDILLTIIRQFEVLFLPLRHDPKPQVRRVLSSLEMRHWLNYPWHSYDRENNQLVSF